MMVMMARFDALHRVAETAPELALVGAIVKVALDEARCGDEASAAWLASEACLNCLSYLVPNSSVSAESLQRALVKRLPAWIRPRLPRRAQGMCRLALAGNE